jgi:hypothetical protein
MIIRAMDRLSLLGMALGVALMLQPWWSGGFGVGFFVVVISTVGQIVFSHMTGLVSRVSNPCRARWNSRMVGTG